MASSLKDGLSVRKTAARCGVSVPTAFRWRHRFLRAGRYRGGGRNLFS
jgi:transposase-like protein